MEISLFEKRILRMRQEDNSYILTILEEALAWNLNLDEIVVLCSVLNILDKHNIAVSRNEVKKAFNKYYNKEFHGDKVSYLTWIYKTFHIKSQTKVFTSQVRKNNPLPQFSEPISASTLSINQEMGCDRDNTPSKVIQPLEQGINPQIVKLNEEPSNQDISEKGEENEN